MVRRLWIVYCATLCWAVVALAVGGLLALAGVLTWRDPTGATIGWIALGPTALLVCGTLAALPFMELYTLLRSDSNTREEAGER